MSFSQGTNDYFQTDWENSLAQEGTKNFSEGEHNFDEAFGYYGATRDINDYTDDEAAGKGGRDGWGNGYHDTNGDGSIEVRSELVLGTLKIVRNETADPLAKQTPPTFPRKRSTPFWRAGKS